MGHNSFTAGGSEDKYPGAVDVMPTFAPVDDDNYARCVPSSEIMSNPLDTLATDGVLNVLSLGAGGLAAVLQGLETPATRYTVIVADCAKEQQLRVARTAYVCKPARASAVTYAKTLEAAVDRQRRELGDAMENISALIASAMVRKRHYTQGRCELERAAEHTVKLRLNDPNWTTRSNVALPQSHAVPTPTSKHPPPLVYHPDTLHRPQSPSTLDGDTTDNVYRRGSHNKPTSLKWRFRPSMYSSRGALDEVNAKLISREATRNRGQKCDSALQRTVACS